MHFAEVDSPEKVEGMKALEKTEREASRAAGSVSIVLLARMSSFYRTLDSLYTTLTAVRTSGPLPQALGDRLLMLRRTVESRLWFRVSNSCSHNFYNR